jgi:hypothetical protein
MGTLGSGAMLVEQVNHLDPQPLERGLGHALDLLRPAIGPHAGSWAFVAVLPAEFGGDHHLPAPRLQRFADQLLVGKGAVHFGGVEKGDAASHGRMEKVDHLPLVRRMIAKAHPHTPKPEG